MALPVLHDIGAVHMTKNNVIQDPGTGGTFVQNGMAYGTATVGAGTYKLPDGGLPQYVQSSGAVTITSVAGVTVAILASGQTALCVPLSSTTWAANVFITGAAQAIDRIPNAQYNTSSTVTSEIPAAGKLTGARHVFYENTADGAKEITTRTATELFGDITGAYVGFSYLLTIVNRGNNTVTLTGSDDVIVSGEDTTATLVTRTYLVTFTSATAVTFLSVSKGTIET